MSKHNKEPWIIEPHEDKAIWAKVGRIYIGECAMKNNAARIVACVNACAGMEDPEYDVDLLKVQRNAYKSDFKRLNEQREIMFKSMEKALHAKSHQEADEIIRTAVAKIRAYYAGGTNA